jgi:hypothetical protein
MTKSEKKFVKLVEDTLNEYSSALEMIDGLIGGDDSATFNHLKNREVQLQNQLAKLTANLSKN